MIISASLRRQVIERAANCCEYCGLAQTGQEAAFHIDHVLPVVAGGNTTLENLALACVSCSLREGPRLLVRDPQTGEHVTMFHPRLDSWRAHFRWDTGCLGLQAAFVLYSPGRCGGILLGATLRAIGFQAGFAGAEDPIGAYRFD